ncbi:MAG TPA: hypothetical protein VF941_00925 [Clostridia bacterium]
MHQSAIIKKLIASVIVWAAFFLISRSFYPVFTNEQALKQMEDTTSSFTDFSMYQHLWNYAWVIPLAICIFIFFNELKELVYKIRGGI